MICAEVAVAAPLFTSLTYLVPDHLADSVLPGMRLLVPLGRRRVTGWCLAVGVDPPAGAAVKAIIEMPDAEPLFPGSMVPLFRWVADYYHFPLGEVIREALPGGLNQASGREVVLTDVGRQKFDGLVPEEYPWAAPLIEKGRLTSARCKKLWRGREKTVLLGWQRDGLVEIHQVLAGGLLSIRKETCIRLAPGRAGNVLLSSPKTAHDTQFSSVSFPGDFCAGSEPEGTDTKKEANARQDFLSPPGDCIAESVSSIPLKKSEQRTLDVFLRLAGDAPDPVVPRSDLAREYSGARKALFSLAEKGIFEVFEQEVLRDPFGLRPPYVAPPEHLTDEQEVAVAALSEAIDRGGFATFLLFGVTSSGKTEVYLQAASAALAKGRSVIVLVPEIALATQLEGHFHSRFGSLVALLHSGLSDGERYDMWRRVARGEARVVVGARSAVFAPMSNLGLIIVDEEHDGAYKQEDGLRYQARDLAVLRGSQTEAVVLLGSATPSVASFQHARQGKYRLLSMHRRVAMRAMPEVDVVDLKEIKGQDGKRPVFSPQLIEAMRQNLAAGFQSLIFLNRRGFASLLLCRQCGEPVRCKNCQISLTLHKGRKQLACHYCGYAVHSDSLCSSCQGSDLVAIGCGTERLEEELGLLLPGARIARLDRDTVNSRRDYYTVLQKVHSGEVDILVGTQMIAKGHHFPGVTLVGIVWADAGLGLPDYKAGERTFQLISQVLGRAGRGETPGRVIVQTGQPNHYSIVCARNHDYNAFFEQEMALRRAFSYPPFSRLVHCCFEGAQEAAVRMAAVDAADFAKRLDAARRLFTVLGPAPAPLARLRGLYRWQFVLQGSRLDVLHTACHRLLTEFGGRGGKIAVKLTVDVDPESML